MKPCEDLSYIPNRFEGEFPVLGKQTPAERAIRYLAEQKYKNSPEHKAYVLKAKAEWREKHSKYRKRKNVVDSKQTLRTG